MVVGNLGKVQRSLGRLSRVLGREEADPKVSRSFYTAVTQVVLLFGAETWILTPRMEKALDSFQSRVARKITGRQPRLKKDERWEYLPLKRSLREAGMVGIRRSITQRQNTVAQYIAMRTILDLCNQATRRPGARVSWRWWEQAGIDLEGARKQAAVSVTRLETDSEEELDGETTREAGGGEEEYQGASGSSGAGRRIIEPRTLTGQESQREQRSIL